MTNVIGELYYQPWLRARAVLGETVGHKLRSRVHDDLRTFRYFKRIQLVVTFELFALLRPEERP